MRHLRGVHSVLMGSIGLRADPAETFMRALMNLDGSFVWRMLNSSPKMEMILLTMTLWG